MPLPMIRSFGCLSLKTGCQILCITSTVASIVNIAIGAVNLLMERAPDEPWDPEDNLICMSMVMFSTLSAIANIVALFGILMNRPGHLQLSIVFNSVFILCIYLVAVVTCIFRMDEFLKTPANIVLVIFLLLAGAAYSIFYMTVVNSFYRIMKMTYGDSAIPL